MGILDSTGVHYLLLPKYRTIELVISWPLDNILDQIRHILMKLVVLEQGSVKGRDGNCDVQVHRDRTLKLHLILFDSLDTGLYQQSSKTRNTIKHLARHSISEN